jgi:hypothetical protein
MFGMGNFDAGLGEGLVECLKFLHKVQTAILQNLKKFQDQGRAWFMGTLFSPTTHMPVRL